MAHLEQTSPPVDAPSHNVEVSAEGDVVISLAYIRFGDKEFYNAEHFVEPDADILNTPCVVGTTPARPREQSPLGAGVAGGSGAAASSSAVCATKDVGSSGLVLVGSAAAVGSAPTMPAADQSQTKSLWQAQIEAEQSQAISRSGVVAGSEIGSRVKQSLFSSDEEDEAGAPRRRLMSTAERERRANR